MRDGGFGLKEADCRCIEQMRLVAKLTDYLRRVNPQGYVEIIGRLGIRK